MKLSIFSIENFQLYDDQQSVQELFNILTEEVFERNSIKVFSMETSYEFQNYAELKTIVCNWLRKYYNQLEFQTISLIIIDGFIIYIDNSLDQQTTWEIVYLNKNCDFEISKNTFLQSKPIGSYNNLVNIYLSGAKK